MSTAVTLLDVSVTPMGGLHLEFVDHPGPTATTSCCRTRCSGGSSGTHCPWPITALGCWPPVSISSAACCSYGPPGTGKTHTTRYLLGRMTDYTRLVAHRPSARRRRLGRRARPRPSSGRGRAGGRRSRRGGALARPGGEPGAVRPAGRDGRRRTGCRSAVPAHHQPGRPPGAGAGGRPGRVDVAVEIPLPTPPPGSGCWTSTAGTSRWRSPMRRPPSRWSAPRA